MHKSVSSTTAAMRHYVLTDAILFGPFAGKPISEPVAKAFLILVGSLLLAVSAQIKIPFYPVPVTGQTLVVLLIGMTYGPRLGGATVAAYLLKGRWDCRFLLGLLLVWRHWLGQRVVILPAF